MNQLRNWRMPERYDKMPFGFLRKAGACYYRKDVIDAWLEEHGSITAEYVPASFDKKIPLNDVLAHDPEKQKQLELLSKITTRNAFTSMATWFIEQSGYENGLRAVHDWGRELVALERGVSEWKTIGRPNNELKASDPDAFWKIWVYGVRKGYATVNNLELSDEEIMSVPVGDVPPLKTD